MPQNWKNYEESLGHGDSFCESAHKMTHDYLLISFSVYGATQSGTGNMTYNEGPMNGTILYNIALIRGTIVPKLLLLGHNRLLPFITADIYNEI